MNDAEVNELAGRVEGLAQAFLHLAALLEMQCAVDGEQLSEALRQRSSGLRHPKTPAEVTDAARRVLVDLADQLDSARDHREQAAYRSQMH